MKAEQVRRTPHLFFYLQDGRTVDVRELLRGIVRTPRVTRIWAISMPAGEEYSLTREELLSLLEIPSEEWSRADGVPCDGALAERFARQGLLICDDPAEPFATFRRRDDSLSATDWNLYASLYHSMKKWQGIDLSGDPGGRRAANRAIDRYVELHGELPSHFYSRAGEAGTSSLPSAQKDGDLYRVLTTRRTVRTFDREAQLSLEDFSTILRYTFGCQGYAPISGGSWILKKTSPSGGGLHPIEAYPLVMNVNGIEPGLYHYNVERHDLERLRSSTENEARGLADVFSARQPYAQDAGALVILTARFPRSFWKYRSHEKAYGVLLMDAGHLSQTFYLVCTDLRLGPFVTAAVNDRDIEEALGIDGYTEGALAVLGVGRPGSANGGRDPVFRPWHPG